MGDNAISRVEAIDKSIRIHAWNALRNYGWPQHACHPIIDAIAKGVVADLDRLSPDLERE